MNSSPEGTCFLFLLYSGGAKPRGFAKNRGNYEISYRLLNLKPWVIFADLGIMIGDQKFYRLSLKNIETINPNLSLRQFVNPSISTFQAKTCIPITNRVRGPYCKLRRRAGHKSERKKRGSVTYSTDQENEVGKIFIISLGSKRWGRFQSSGMGID